MVTDFEVGKIYSFNTLVPSILGLNFNGLKVKSLMSYDVALKFENVEVIQKTILPFLPNNLSNNNKLYTYILFENSQGVNKVLASEWIDKGSANIVSSVNLSITVYDISNRDIQIIRDLLTLNGYNNIIMSEVNV